MVFVLGAVEIIVLGRITKSTFAVEHLGTGLSVGSQLEVEVLVVKAEVDTVSKIRNIRT